MAVEFLETYRKFVLVAEECEGLNYLALPYEDYLYNNYIHLWSCLPAIKSLSREEKAVVTMMKLRALSQAIDENEAFELPSDRKIRDLFK